MEMSNFIQKQNNKLFEIVVQTDLLDMTIAASRLSLKRSVFAKIYNFSFDLSILIYL